MGYFTDNELPWYNDDLDKHLTLLAKDEQEYFRSIIIAKGKRNLPIIQLHKTRDILINDKDCGYPCEEWIKPCQD